MASLSLVTAPTAEPCVIADAKAYCRVDSTDDDNLFTSLLTAARNAAEAYTGRAFMTQTWKQVLDTAPGDVLFLPKAPLVSITHIKFTDSDSVQGSAVASSVYVVDTASSPGRVLKKPNQSWGYTSLRTFMATEIQFVVGYGSTAATGSTVGSCPGDIILAIKRMILDAYENRERLTGNGDPSRIPPGARELLDPHRLLRL